MENLPSRKRQQHIICAPQLKVEQFISPTVSVILIFLFIFLMTIYLQGK